MRYMRWSWLDYLHTPPEVIEEVLAMAQEEVERMQEERGA